MSTGEIVRSIDELAPRMTNAVGPCYLGALAPELLDLILLHVDSVKSLGNFMRVSRFIHHRFMASREQLIYSMLQKELGPVLVDAEFLLQIPWPGPQEWQEEMVELHDQAEKLTLIMNKTKEGQHTSSTVPALEQLNQLCSTYRNMSTLFHVYFRSYLHTFGGRNDRTPDPMVTAPISSVERLRILRSLYRRQILCNAVAPGESCGPFQHEPEHIAALCNTYPQDNIRIGFFAAFEPWELQQVDHMNYFLVRFSYELSWQADLNNKPLSVDDHTAMLTREGPFSQYIEANPKLVDSALTQPLLLPKVRSPFGDWCTDQVLRGGLLKSDLVCLGHNWQTERFSRWPDPLRDETDHYNAEGDWISIRDIKFSGDDVDQIPFGWVYALNGEYTHWFGFALLIRHQWMGVPRLGKYIQTILSLSLWRCAGFTFWDRPRVEALKELEEFTGLNVRTREPYGSKERPVNLDAWGPNQAANGTYWSI